MSYEYCVRLPNEGFCCAPFRRHGLKGDATMRIQRGMTQIRRLLPTYSIARRMALQVMQDKPRSAVRL